jgi:hypothetical protein
MNAAKKLADRQRRFDLLHHQMRVADLSSLDRKLTWIERDMLRSSERIVASPDANLTRSVDLSDAEYLRDLEMFESSNRARQAAE